MTEVGRLLRIFGQVTLRNQHQEGGSLTVAGVGESAGKESPLRLYCASTSTDSVQTAGRFVKPTPLRGHPLMAIE